MNDIFDIRRFGRYLAYDINNAKNNFGLSLLISGLLPVIFFTITQILSRIITGDWAEINVIHQILALGIALVTIFCSFPSKTYGPLTDRRAGSNWLMLPASAFEKFLSMLVISILVLPLCFAVLFLGSDALLSLLFPNYAQSLIHNIANLHEFMQIPEDAARAIPMYDQLPVHFWTMIFLGWVVNILFFVLGAIWFKRSKAAKTILTGFGISLVSGSLEMKFTDRAALACQMCDPAQTVDFIESMLKLTYWSSAVQIVILAVLIYARIKTLKH